MGVRCVKGYGIKLSEQSATRIAVLQRTPSHQTLTVRHDRARSRFDTTDAFSLDTNRASRHRATRRLEAALDVPCALATGGGGVLAVGELVGDRYVERRNVVAIVEGDAVAVVLAHPLVVRGEEV